MICPDCKKIVSPFDETCQHCGTALKSNPVKDYEKKAQQVVKDAEGRADDIKEQIRSGFGRAKKLSSLNEAGSPGVPWMANLGSIRSTGVESQPTDKSAFSEWSPASDKWQRSRMIEELVTFVLSNRHLKDNPAYFVKVEETRFIYLEDDTTVNASAGFDGDRMQPYVLLYDGYLNFIIAVEATIQNGSRDAFSRLGRLLLDKKFRFSTELLQDYLDRNASKSQVSFEKAMNSYFWTVAHELGHVCYDHVLGPGYDDQPLDVSRNQERDADSFADSLMASTIFKDSLFEAHLKSCVGWAVVEKVGGRVEPGTHPLAIERLRNTIRNNSEAAKQMGVSGKWVDEIFG